MNLRLQVRSIYVQAKCWINRLAATSFLLGVVSNIIETLFLFGLLHPKSALKEAGLC